MSRIPPSTLCALHAAYRAKTWRPSEIVEHWLARPESERGLPLWISTTTPQEIRDRATALDRMLAEDAQRALAQPLFGALVAIKDNIDVKGLFTTAACPAFAYEPNDDAEVVLALRAAGAIVVGKTNLDQFATGLVGTRSPYGAVPNAFDPGYVGGGSSSGSAVAVARGLVHVALGTDTAGSGRIPAALSNIVGWKPSRNAISTRGIVPACASIDCVSIFALTVADAARVFAAARMAHGPAMDRPRLHGAFTFAVPRREDREFYGDTHAAQAFDQAIAHLEALGGRVREIDFAPWRAVATMLYEGPRVAERHAAIRAFFDARPDVLDPVVRGIIGSARRYTASDVYVADAALARMREQLDAAWSAFDVLMVPTAPTIYTISEIEREPVELNRRLGTYTNFVNLLDLAAIAVPAAMRADGLPSGITLIAPSGSDLMLADLAQRVHAHTGLPLGALGVAQPPMETLVPRADVVQLAVVGAHLSGMPLNRELTQRGARLVRAARTAPHYRLYALRGTTPAKPGLVRDDAEGRMIDVEVWELSLAAFGAFVAAIPPPLGIGTLELDDGALVKGFLCEAIATRDADDISHYGGWRRYIATAAASRISS